ncbi:unnamed protein product [marine sediment metagenome]|uniref:CARDB domain-containing protein n=1 Tax=marine sediment metagenome TaxID=412755 RepID=X1PVY0_9ZZZZ
MEGYENPPVAGPRLIGQLAAIAAGAFTEIVAISAPDSAAYGDLVNIEVRVRNLHTGPIYIAVDAQYNGSRISFSPEYASVGAGATYSFTGSFSMPNNDVRLHVWSYYWTGEEWHDDDYSYVDIALAAPPEVYAGTISRKELEYDSRTSTIPVY